MDRLVLEMDFVTMPPPSAHASEVLPEQVLVSSTPFTKHNDEYYDWIPGPGERLRFECEFIPEGAGSSNHGICRTSFGQDLLGGMTMIGFDLKIVPHPGNYILQVTGYLLREGMEPIALKRISSGPIQVLDPRPRRAT
jgi:hypothetical protein